jgi:hypothetical protein
MAQLAEVLSEGSAAPRFDPKPNRAFEALRLAIVEAENGTRVSDLEDETSKAIDCIREASAWRRNAEERISDLEAALEALRASTRQDLLSVEERAKQAETKLKIETQRTISAERRVRVAEDQLAQVMAVIENELKPRAARD